MKYITFYFIVLILVAACDAREKDKTASIFKIDSSTDSIVQQVSVISGWPAPVYKKLKKFDSLFVKYDLRRYDCSDLDKYYTDNGTTLHPDGLVQVNEHVCKQLFGDYSNNYGTFCNSYLYSIEKPVQNFYPVTVIQNFGVAERPLIMILYNGQGDIVTSFEIADLYGETGGCLSSHFINDSTLVQNFKWDDFGIDSSTQQDIYESEYMTQELIILKSGKIITRQLKRWKEIR